MKITETNLEDYYEFSEEEFLGRTDMSCGICNGTGKYKKQLCFECNGSGELWGDGDHECGDWDTDEIDFDGDAHASIDRTCPTCHQLSRLHFWRKK